MKIASVLLLVFASAEDKKVPPRHPLQRLERLTQFSTELLDTWFDFLPSQHAWRMKFRRNGERMARNFQRGEQRCGHYNEDQLPHGGPARKRRSADQTERYNRDDPVEGVKQLTTGYRKWAERYLSQCSGQMKYQHQTKRMNNWNQKLQDHLAAYFLTTTTTTTSTTTKTTTTSTTTTSTTTSTTTITTTTAKGNFIFFILKLNR